MNSNQQIKNIHISSRSLRGNLNSLGLVSIVETGRTRAEIVWDNWWEKCWIKVKRFNNEVTTLSKGSSWYHNCEDVWNWVKEDALSPWGVRTSSWGGSKTGVQNTVSNANDTFREKALLTKCLIIRQYFTGTYFYALHILKKIVFFPLSKCGRVCGRCKKRRLEITISIRVSLR